MFQSGFYQRMFLVFQGEYTQNCPKQGHEKAMNIVLPGLEKGFTCHLGLEHSARRMDAGPACTQCQSEVLLHKSFSGL